MVELKGSLSGIGLPAIIQLIGELHHSGRLELSKLADRGELGFDDGRLVSASFADLRGLKALAACSHQLADADFRFVETRHTGERTIDIAAPELQLYLTQLMRGDAPPEPVSGPPVKPAEVVAPGPCPFLGFADDPSRHYSRPTALHRCFAAGAAGLVSGLEQRELCLAGRYATCPRYQTATAAAAVPAPVEPAWRQPPARQPAASEPVQRQAAPPEPVHTQTPPSRPVPLAPAADLPRPAAPPPATPPRPAPYPPAPASDLPPPLFETPPPPRTADVPAGVTARLAAFDQPHSASAAAADAANPAYDVANVPAERPARSNGQFTLPARKPRRGMLLLAIGAVLGIVVLAGVLAVVVPALEGSFAQPGNQSFEPVATPVRTLVAIGPSTTPASAARPGTVAAVPSVAAPKPIAAPSPGVASSQPATAPSPALAATAPPSASPPPLSGQLILDALFATGPAPDWLENPPYATWSDGAYRLAARDRGNFVAVDVPLDGELSDVIVAATFRKTAGPPGGGYGLIIRTKSAQPLDGANQNLSAYVFEAGDKGEFGVWRREGDRFVDLVPWTSSNMVRAGGSPNDLLVRAVGSQLTFMINGAEVKTVEDQMLTAGGVGVFVGGDNNEVALDHFTVQLPN